MSGAGMKPRTRIVLFVVPVFGVTALSATYTRLNMQGKIIKWTGTQDLPAQANLYTIVFCLLLLAGTAICWETASRRYSLRWRLMGCALFAVIGIVFLRWFVSHNAWL